MMEKKITIQEFSEIISERCYDVSSEDIELTLKALFNDASQQLQAKGIASIPGIGTFKKMSPEDGYIDLDVDKDLAEAINAPFQFFSAVELDDEYCEEDFKEAMPERDEDETAVAEEEVVEPNTEKVNEQVESESIDEVKLEGGISQCECDSFETVASEENEENAVKEDIDEYASEAKLIPPEMPEIPQVDSVEIAQTPPPFNLSEVYNPSSQYIIEPDEEEFVGNGKGVSTGKKFVNGLICGIVICLALAAIAAVVYNLYFN